jgi:hypothetical protein
VWWICGKANVEFNDTEYVAGSVCLCSNENCTVFDSSLDRSSDSPYEWKRAFLIHDPIPENWSLGHNIVLVGKTNKLSKFDG